MSENLRIATLALITEKQPNIGKTSILKYMFFLQHCFSVKLGYNFSIYTYGPYSQDVMADLDLAVYYKAVNRSYVDFNGYGGYQFTKGDNSKTFIGQCGAYPSQIEPHINRLVGLFSAKNAKDMELLATIAYVHIALGQQNQNLSQLPSIVKALKPHFDVAEIAVNYDWLKQESILR
ncbi:MAG: hypothetical protein LBS31_11660 [Candidatus Adiutrix sp.]|jgi:hypothetical protein|nr:hypothetical protein [Candidatus Adiutrix sp.]